jgi:hypothetical protein
MKKWILPLLIGWGLSMLFGPRDLIGLVKPKA